MEKIKLLLIPLSVALLFLSVLLEPEKQDVSTKEVENDTLFILNNYQYANLSPLPFNNVYKQNDKAFSDDYNYWYIKSQKKTDSSLIKRLINIY